MGPGLATRAPTARGSPGAATSGHPGASGGCGAGLRGGPDRCPTQAGERAPRPAAPADRPPGDSQRGARYRARPHAWGSSLEPEQGWPPIVQMSKMRPSRAETVGQGALGRSSQFSTLHFPRMAPGLEGLGNPRPRLGQRPVPPPAPTAAGWRRAAAARWQGYCTAAPARSPAGPGGTEAGTWAPAQLWGHGAVGGSLHTPLLELREEWCPGADRVRSEGPLQPTPSLCLSRTVSLQASGHSHPVVWKVSVPLT